MGRHSKNITIQINQRVNDLLRIGQGKVKNDPTNPNRSEGIHSIRTANTYRSVGNSFAGYLKGQGVRNIGNITKEHISGYMLSRAGLSAYTQSKDLAAINKLLDTRYTLRDFGLRERSHQRITNNRGLARYDTSHAVRNREQLAFVRSTGIRRESIATITPAQALRDGTGLVVGFHVIEKGGRERNCVVLAMERERITHLVDNHIVEQGVNAPLFRAVDSNANPHWQRREYAQALYNDLRETQGDYYSGLRDSFINQENLERATSRYATPTVRGYERDVLAEVSQALGHNRLDVVIYHYLK